MRHVALVLVAACSLGGKPPHYDYFVLTSTRAIGAQPVAVNQPVLAVGQVTIPGYLDREPIATRVDDHRLIYSARERWAEPVDQAFERTLREDLAATLAPAGITVQPHAGAPTYDLDVEVLRFERRGADRVELWARWMLHADARRIDSGETRIIVPMSSLDGDAMAAALSQAIARMATEVAERLTHKNRAVSAS
ncbi:MAG: hypothetical protein JWO36_3342 [Myxococcales bacterium]|nr:hypothetical protein [Myxococcales bacterium]